MEREDGPGVHRSFEGESLPKSTDRSHNAPGQVKDGTTRRRVPRVLDNLIASSGPSTNDKGVNELDHSAEEGSQALTPKMYQSNSFNIADGDHPEGGDDPDHRQGSMKGGARTLNAAKFIFNRDRDAKSKSTHQKTSKSANSKVSAGPALASVKKFLQSSFTKPSLPNSGASPNKTFDEGPTTKTLPFSSPGDLRQSGEHWTVFKKPVKDLVFNRSGRAVGNSSGLGTQHSPPEERASSSRHDN